MKNAVILVGVGEMGGVFARAILRLGYPLLPVIRGQSMDALAAEVDRPELVLVAVAEKDLPMVLQRIPAAWNNRLVLLQNELLPNDWVGLDNPTVISVWFEKKKGADSRVIMPSPVFGPKAAVLARALATLGIPVRVLASADELLFELVVKNLYILTSNIAGLRSGGTVGELWQRHETLARAVAVEVIALQQALSGRQFDAEELIQAMLRAFQADPEHQCMGRSAPARLARALALGASHGLSLPTLEQLAG
jgi:hypothetical protein